jgi:hypothetical protein
VKPCCEGEPLARLNWTVSGGTIETLRQSVCKNRGGQGAH